MQQEIIIKPVSPRFLHPASGSQVGQFNGIFQMFNILPPGGRYDEFNFVSEICLRLIRVAILVKN